MLSLAGKAPKDTLKRHKGRKFQNFSFLPKNVCVHSICTGPSIVERSHQLVHHCLYYLFVTKKTSPPFCIISCQPILFEGYKCLQMFCRNTVVDNLVRNKGLLKVKVFSSFCKSPPNCANAVCRNLSICARIGSQADGSNCFFKNIKYL